MSSRIRQLAVPSGSVIFSPGQPCPGFVTLRTGTIRVSLTAENGREVVLYRVRPGDVCLQTFACLINGDTYAAEGIAETDIEGDLLPPPLFEARLAQDPDFRRTVFSAVAKRFEEFEKLVEDVALTGFEARLARVLLRLRTTDNRVEATHQQLARETASGRAFVSRKLSEMARAGLVAVGRGKVTLLDIDGLARIAADDR